MKKRVLFFTSTRADFGLLSRLIRLFIKDSTYQVELLVTGSHLSKKFGNSVDEITAEGISIRYKVDINLVSDLVADVSASAGVGVSKYTDVLLDYKPDLAFVLGDRFEALSFAFACQLSKTVLVHLHGGEVTEGAIDDAFRHCITKLSKFHFASAEVHKNRIIQLGESPEDVFNVGALGVDNAVLLHKKSKQELSENLKIQFKEKNFLVTFHPETLSENSSEQQMTEFLKALQTYIADNPTSYFIFTLPNFDPGHQSIIDQVKLFVTSNTLQAIYFETLGYVNYLSVMSYCVAVIGNSSSGLIEAPALNCPTLNVGDRQKGRLKGNSVLDVEIKKEKIIEGLYKVVELFESKSKIDSVYGNGQTAEKIKMNVDQLIKKPISLRKKFYDRN